MWSFFYLINSVEPYLLKESCWWHKDFLFVEPDVNGKHRKIQDTTVSSSFLCNRSWKEKKEKKDQEDPQGQWDLQ